MKIRLEEKFKGKGTRKCKLCGNARGLIRSHKLYICRKCFREFARDIGFQKFG